MNSWKSTLVSACAPPFRMFIIGTGRSDDDPGDAGECVEAGDVPIERQATGGGLRAKGRHRDAEQRVGAEAALGRRAVEADHRLVQTALRERAADERGGELAVDVGDRLADALAEVSRARRPAVPAPLVRRWRRPKEPPRVRRRRPRA